MGKRPKSDDLNNNDTYVHPRERLASWAQLFTSGITPLKAIKRKCPDCSGGIQAEVRDCQHTDCALWPFRCGRNPNRAGIGGTAPPLSKNRQR